MLSPYLDEPHQREMAPLILAVFTFITRGEVRL
jgi:hypothetical protein